MYLTRESQKTLLVIISWDLLLVQVLSVEVKPDLRHKIQICPLVLLRRHWLVIKGPCAFKGKQTSFQEVGRIAEFPLDPQEISKVKEAFVMIKVFLQEVHQVADIIGGLDTLKLLL